MLTEPLYQRDNLDPAYQLRYSWTAWPSNGTAPAPLYGESWESLQAAWETDGLRVLERAWSSDAVQILFSATPDVSPVFLAGRAKGRLDHAYRQIGRPCKFSRKLAVRSVGDNTRQDV